MFRQLSINMSQVKYLCTIFPKAELFCQIILVSVWTISIVTFLTQLIRSAGYSQLIAWLVYLPVLISGKFSWLDYRLIFGSFWGGGFNGEITTVITTLYFQLYTFFNFLDHLSHFCFVSPPFFLNKKIFSQHCSTRFCCPTSGRSFSVHLCRRTLCTEVKASVSVPVYHLFHYWLLLTQVKLVVNIFRSVVRKRSEKKEWWEY